MSAVSDSVHLAATPEGAAVVAKPVLPWVAGAAGSIAWLTVAALTHLWPDIAESDWVYTDLTAIATAALGGLLVFATLSSPNLASSRRVQRYAPWFLVLALFFAA